MNIFQSIKSRMSFETNLNYSIDMIGHCFIIYTAMEGD